MNSGYAGGGSPSRTLSTMSLTVGPARCINSRSITRSQSFTGVNTSTRPYRSVTALNTPGLCRKPSRASRMFTMSNKSNPPPKVPQPERLDEVYKALRTGLQSYLQVHQIELENLSRQMKESKRNSRLGFLYELDKQVKMTERFIRRLEFHLSKMEELYEAYCLQRRLRDGANKMVKAFTNSLSSKEARESLAEANKGYKEYTENMCMLENELENQLGEFHIKMKGLAGFARLCAGDQYEIFMKYGRQRWKLRGRIEINAKQVWDSEEMVFLPLINDFLSVKVTELKSLANHVVVGSVSCEAKDLFAALPQTVAVDINDLGTIKLSLQVTWSPFDMDDQGSVAGTVNKAPTVSKRLLILNHHLSPPDTPSLREQAFYNMLQSQDELENGAAWSHSSESSDESSGAELSAEALRNTADDSALTPELLPHSAGTSSSQPDVSFCPRDSAASTPNSTHKGSGDLKASADSNRENLDEASTGHEQEHAGTVHVVNSSHSYSRSLSHISESSADGTVSTDRDAGIMEEGTPLTCVNGIETESPSVAVEPPSLVAADGDVSLRRPEVIEEHSDAPEVTHEQQDGFSLCSLTTETVDRDAPTQPQANAESESTDVTYVARRVSVEEEPSEDQLVDSGLDEALEGVVSSLDDYRGQFPELQLLEQELKLLQVTLKGGRHSRSSSVVSLTVETALGSFDFLNTSDWEDEDEDEPENRNRTVRSLQDRRCDSPTSPSSHLTTGCTILDSTLVAHLKNCSAQLLHLGTFGPLRCGEMYALDRLLREARVLEMIRHTATVNPRRLRQPAEVTPQLSLCVGAVSLWQQCVGQGSVYSAPVEVFLLTLSTVYSSMLPDKARNMADTVFSCLTERLLGQRLLRRGGNRDTRMVTLFQLWSYLEANAITDMDTHITELAEEVWLVQNLTSCDQDVIVQTLRRPPECSLRREGVHAVAKLLKDPRGKVSASASSVLRGLATQPRHREQALVSCLELLEDENTDTRVCGCKALACLKAKESINQLVYLCRTDNEEVRDAAKQALLVLGEEGKMAHRHIEMCMDGIPRLFAPGSMASTAF